MSCKTFSKKTLGTPTKTSDPLSRPFDTTHTACEPPQVHRFMVIYAALLAISTHWIKRRKQRGEEGTSTDRDVTYTVR